MGRKKKACRANGENSRRGLLALARRRVSDTETLVERQMDLADGNDSSLSPTNERDDESAVGPRMRLDQFKLGFKSRGASERARVRYHVACAGLGLGVAFDFGIRVRIRVQERWRRRLCKASKIAH